MPFFRRTILAAAALFALAACGQNSAGGAAAPAAGDMFLGGENAPVTLIEYASTTCPHCAQWHDTVFGPIKAKYIDTKKIKYIFREFPTPPEDIAVAEFMIARCAGKDKYFPLLDTFFKEQRNIMEAAQSPTGAKPPLLAIARQAGLSEEQFEACIADPKAQKAILETAQKGAEQFKITGTPTLILNGEPMPGDKHPEMYNLEGITKVLDAKLAAAGKK